jgi:hypothetical protein
VSALARRFVENFEQTHGYEPGENGVDVVADGSTQAAEALSAAGVPADLVDFYSHVEAVNLPDVDNGYFIHSADRVLDGIRGEQPTELTGTVRDTITVFGSDGGGGLFAVNQAGDRVYRLGGGSLIGSTYDADDSEATVTASSLWEFLEGLRAKVASEVS